MLCGSEEMMGLRLSNLFQIIHDFVTPLKSKDGIILRISSGSVGQSWMRI